MVRDLFNSDATVTGFDEKIAILNFDNALFKPDFVRCLIFEKEEEILGYAFLSFSYSTSLGKKYIWLEDLYVKKEFRGKGIGKYFIKWLCREYANKINMIKLEVTKNNRIARNFYKSLKFKDSAYLEMCFLF